MVFETTPDFATTPEKCPHAGQVVTYNGGTCPQCGAPLIETEGRAQIRLGKHPAAHSSGRMNTPVQTQPEQPICAE